MSITKRVRNDAQCTNIYCIEVKRNLDHDIVHIQASPIQMGHFRNRLIVSTQNTVNPAWAT